MELIFAKRNKTPKNRKINFYIGKKLIASAYPWFGWYACSMSVDDEVRKEIRKVVMENLYWLTGCDCDVYEWQKTIDSWNTGKHLYGATANVSSLFFSNEEKEIAFNSFYNI